MIPTPKTDEQLFTSQLRSEILIIMNRLRFIDLSTHSKQGAQDVIRSMASGLCGDDVDRIAADRVIDCLMWL